MKRLTRLQEAMIEHDQDMARLDRNATRNMKADHTPLPWAIYDYGGQIPRYPKNIIEAPTGESIAIIEGGWPQCTQAENEANARFIVKAVNSHDALIEALQRLIDSTAGGDNVQIDAARQLAEHTLRGIVLAETAL